MTINYKATNIPDELYGRTYTCFDVEIDAESGKPVSLHLVDFDGNESYITELEKIGHGTVNPYDDYFELGDYTIYDLYGSKNELRDRLKRAEENRDRIISKMIKRNENVLAKVCRNHNYHLFKLFLKTLVIDKSFGEWVKDDINFIENYYNVKIKVEGETNDKT